MTLATSSGKVILYVWGSTWGSAFLVLLPRVAGSIWGYTEVLCEAHLCVEGGAQSSLLLLLGGNYECRVECDTREDSGVSGMVSTKH